MFNLKLKVKGNSIMGWIPVFTRMTHRKGFSLIELLIVVTIISVLSGAAYIGIQKAKIRNMNNKVTADLVAISNALESYKQDHFGKYPIPEPIQVGGGRVI